MIAFATVTLASCQSIFEYGDCPTHKSFDVNFVLAIDTPSGTRAVWGDTEPTDELRALRDIDIAFICVNQPYTMTPDEAVEAVEAIRPKIYYPYHWGQVDEPTDVEALAERLKSVCDVRIRPLA